MVFAFFFFFFQAEDGIRDLTVTGVQTCALPILTTGLPIRRSISSTASTDRHAVQEHSSASASGRHARDANSTTTDGSWSLMPWLPDFAAVGSASRFRTSKPCASRYARRRTLFHSG